MSAGKNPRRLFTGVAFLLPNIAGFCAFTLLPLVLSFVLAFSDWDIQRHNLFRREPLHFTLLENFARLLADPLFWRDLGNTFFLMLGLPFAIAGSLGAALLLTRTGGQRTRVGPALVAATLVFIASAALLLRGGMAVQGVWFLFGTLAAAVLVAGVVTRGTVYRTLFYLPHFTAGVATFVLWKKLYNPHTGPFSLGLAPVLDGLGAAVRRAPGFFTWGLPALALLGGALIAAWHLRRLRQHWDDGDSGSRAVIAGAIAPAVPLAFLLHWLGRSWLVAGGIALLGAVITAWVILRRPRPPGPRRAADTGLGTEFAVALALIPLLFILAGAVRLGPLLPDLAAAGLEPPNWLGDYDWAKPSLMLMALWAAIGSNSMILYLAGLSNIPPELYEAADMDGASASQRFWHITWPQLAPITFFVAVMGVINGLQGGFEMARTMTLGGPAGSTTTLSYFIFNEGFETGRLGYASAIAWVLFALVFLFSFFNFRFGNRDANE